MVDRAAIFSDVTRRAALRREALLPPLDVQAEYKHQVALAEEREFRALLPELEVKYAADRERIEAQVIADLWGERGKEFIHTKGGRWAIVHYTNREFKKFLWEMHGIAEPPPATVNPIVYGGGKPQANAPTEQGAAEG